MPSTLHHGELVPSSNVPPSGGYPSSPEENAPETPSLSLRDFIEILRRRKLVAINVFVLVVALGFVVTLMTKPVFRTGARILVEGRTSTLAFQSSDDPLSSVFQPKSGRDVNTQIEILRSPLVLDRVYKKANVLPGQVTLDVQRVDLTDAIDLTATSNSSDAAERFITTLPKVYEEDMQRDRLAEVKHSLEFAQSSLQAQKAKLQSTEVALENFRNRSRVVDPKSEATNAINDAATSRSDLAKALLDNTRLRAQFDAVNAERQRLSKFIDTPITTTNPLVQQLSDQLAALNSDRAQKLFFYKANDDEIRKVDLQISELKSRLSRTPRTITNTSRAPNAAIAELDAKVSDARSNYEASQKALAPLRQQVASLNSNTGRFNNIQLREARLARDHDNSADAYNTLSKSVLQLQLRKTALDSVGPPVTTMQEGGPALQIAPRMSRNILAALFLGALLACGAALLQESLDDHIRDQEEARRLFDTSVLGYFPIIDTKGARPVLNLDNSDKGMLESFRVLRSNVNFALVSGKGQKLLVTSSVPGEGKSFIASNLAITMAMNGRTVILVDTDLHRPRQHEIFGVSRYPGLTDALVGDAKLRDCVQEVGIPGLRLIAAGITPPNPAELLGSAVMDALLERLAKGADVVIFDSPPILATSDSQVMSSKVDGVIYVMQLGRVTRSATKRSFELLRQARARIVGMVFNQMDNTASKSYGGYGGYYYSDYADDTADGEAKGLPKANHEGTQALLTRAKRLLNERTPSQDDEALTVNQNGSHSDSPTNPDRNGDNRAV